MLIRNHNNKASIENYNICSREQYIEILSPVMNILSSGSRIEIDEAKNTLLELSGIRESIIKIVDSGIVPGIAIAYGTKKYQDYFAYGNQQEYTLTPNGGGVQSLEPIRVDTIFDLASVTKLFTLAVTLKMIETGILDLDAEIEKYDNRFLNIQHIKIKELLDFSVKLATDKRIELLNSVHDAEQSIFNIGTAPAAECKRYYNDMGAIVLKYIVESVTGKDFYSLLNDIVLQPCGMIDTYIDIPESELHRTASNNFERKIIDDEYIFNGNVYKGVVHDPKARVLSTLKRQLHGHAGLFSTIYDVAKFAQAFIDSRIINRALVNEIGINRTGKLLEDGDYSQFLGYLCYSKHPVSKQSEVYHPLSGNAFASGGYTGNQLTVDPQNEVFSFMAGNRCHNRVTSIIAGAGKNRASYLSIANESMAGWNDGKDYFISDNFAWERDTIVHKALQLSLQYRFLETIYNCD